MILSDPNNIKMHLAADLDVLCELNPKASSVLETLIPTNVKSADKA